MKRIEKTENKLGNYLGYPLWLVKINGAYRVQKMATGEIVDNYRLFFKNLKEVENFVDGY